MDKIDAQMVALPRRAWIEINIEVTIIPLQIVALPRRAWIEIISDITINDFGIVALPRRAWIEIYITPFSSNFCCSRSPQESVD